MRPWLILLGGLLIWFVHFMGVYGIASLADVLSDADAPASRMAVGGFTLVCAAGEAWLVWLAFRRGATGLRDAPDGLTRFWASVAGGGAALSFVAVLWQGLPAIIGH